MFEERDTRAPAWAWLRGFAWFLLAWPLFSLLALDKLDFADWESIALAVLGPAAIGLILLALEAALTRLLGRSSAAQAPPSLLRDLSNLGINLAILLVIDLALVTFADDDPLLRGGDPAGARLAASMLALFCGAALALRGAARLVHGPARRELDLGPGWDRAPSGLRFLGYLTLIPTLLVCTVMIDSTLHRRPDFGLTAWLALPALLWLGLRSATARAPRWWARTPWEAWLRRASLALPWWTLALASALGFAALCFLLPFGVIDDDLSLRARIVGGVVMIPLGLVVLAGAGAACARVPALVRAGRAAWRLMRGSDAVRAWTLAAPGEVHLDLRDGGPTRLEFGPDAPALVAWLEARGVPQATSGSRATTLAHPTALRLGASSPSSDDRAEIE